MGSRNPHDFACLNTNTNLASQGWSIEFVRKPTGVKRRWLANSEISSIESDLAGAANVTLESVVEVDLHGI